MKNILFLVKVEGESCWPELVSGRRYFASRLPRIKRGRFLVFKNPADKNQILVKKLLTISDSSMLELGGTVAWSSRYHDPKSAVLGTLISNAKISF